MKNWIDYLFRRDAAKNRGWRMLLTDSMECVAVQISESIPEFQEYNLSGFRLQEWDGKNQTWIDRQTADFRDDILAIENRRQNK